MQHGRVGRRLEVTEHGQLVERRVAARAQHLGRLIAVAGEDDVVKLFGRPVGKRQPNGAARRVRHGAHRTPQVHGRGRHVLHDGVNVALRAAGDGHPRRARRHGREQVVVPHEAHQRDGGEVEGALVRVGRPDGRRHGDQVVVAEGVRVALTLEVGAYRLLVHGGRFGGGVFLRDVPVCRGARDGVLLVFVFQPEQVECELVEADNVEEHAPDARVEDIAALREDGRERGAGPLKGAAVARDAEGHFRLDGLHVK